MKVNDPNLSSAAGTNRAQQAEQTDQKTRAAHTPGKSGADDDVHLSELVKNLRSLAADSPERQAHLEEIARAYATGAYKVDAHATAAKIIDDAIEP